MKSFLSKPRVHRLCVTSFIVFSTMLVMLHISGCGGTVLNDIGSIVETILASLQAISAALSFVPGIGAVAATISDVLEKVQQEVVEIQALIKQYTTTAGETTLQQIEAAIQLAIDNIQPLLAPTGLPAALATKIGAIAQVILTQFEAWVSAIQALKPAPAPTTAALEPHVSTTHTVSKPLGNSALRSKINAIIKEKTGDAVIDAAWEHVNEV